MQNFSELFIEGNMLITSLVRLCNKYHISTFYCFLYFLFCFFYSTLTNFRIHSCS